MKQGKMDLIKYLAILVLLGIGLWQTQNGEAAGGSGLIAGAIAVFIVTMIKQSNIRKAQAQGINPIDERIWTIAGKAAYSSYVTYTLVLAVIVLLGSVWGPQMLVSPYQLLGFCVAGIVFLYIVFFYYYNYKL